MFISAVACKFNEPGLSRLMCCSPSKGLYYPNFRTEKLHVQDVILHISLLSLKKLTEALWIGLHRISKVIITGQKRGQLWTSSLDNTPCITVSGVNRWKNFTIMGKIGSSVNHLHKNLTLPLFLCQYKNVSK